jgi:hypothetical protein
VLNTLGASIVDEKKRKLKNMDKPVYNVLNPNENADLTCFLIDSLSKDGETRIVNIGGL